MFRRSGAGSSPRRDGFALIASLWLMVAIAALSLEISSSARNHRLAAANTLETQLARAASNSGLDHARARLARLVSEGGDGRSWRDPRHIADPWHALDSVIRSGAGRQHYDVRLFDLGARLNVNLADDAELRRYFTALRLDAGRVEMVVQEILDWIDSDQASRLHGAERSDYLREGARDLPPNLPVDDVDELAAVRGMTPALMQRLRVDFTTRGSGRVNVNTASRAVLLSLLGISESAADAIVREREGGRRIDSWNTLMNLAPRQARAALQQASLPLLNRLVYQTTEVGAESTGSVDGSPVQVTTGAVLVRAGPTVFMTWSGAR